MIPYDVNETLKLNKKNILNIPRKNTYLNTKSKEAGGCNANIELIPNDRVHYKECNRYHEYEAIVTLEPELKWLVKFQKHQAQKKGMVLFHFR